MEVVTSRYTNPYLAPKPCANFDPFLVVIKRRVENKEKYRKGALYFFSLTQFDFLSKIIIFH